MAECVIPVAEPAEEKTLRNILSRKFPKGMPEDCIAIVLRAIIRGIRHIHILEKDSEPEVNAELIGVFWGTWEYFPHSIRLVYDEGHMVTGDDPERPEVGVWGAGIVALELAYGSLPQNIAPQQLVTMAKNLMRILTQKLDNEQKKIKKLPNRLQMLLNDEYVNRREQKLIAKKNVEGIRWAKKVLEDSVRSLPIMETHQKRSFSRDFLVVVMKCLDKDHPTPINQILELPFLQNARDMAYFESRVRFTRIMAQFL